MHGSGASGNKVFGRFTEPAHRVLDLTRAEAERAGHRYLGPEHLLLGLLAEGHSRAAQLLRAARVELAAARVALARLVNRGVVPAPRPSDGELLGSLGIDLDAVRHETEQRFGIQVVGEATWRVTRRRWWWGNRVVWTPLCGPPLVAKGALQLASEQAHALGHDEVRPGHLLLGVLRTRASRQTQGEDRGGTGGSACPTAIRVRPGCCWRRSRLIWIGCGMRPSSS
jgi:ATP-dependent Clp protease ATP-binding subunit ClpA